MCACLSLPAYKKKKRSAVRRSNRKSSFSRSFPLLAQDRFHLDAAGAVPVAVAVLPQVVEDVGGGGGRVVSWLPGKVERRGNIPAASAKKKKRQVAADEEEKSLQQRSSRENISPKAHGS